MNVNSEQITLIGAGLAGSLLATMLAQKGYKVTVFERRPDMRKVNIAAGRSINLALANRGIAALEAIGVMNQVKPYLIPMTGRMLHHQEGQLQFQKYGSRPEEVIYSVSRRDLNGLLMDSAEQTGQVEIIFNQKCIDVDFNHHQLTFNNETSGETYPLAFNRVIGTDGSASVMREALLKVNQGHINYLPLSHRYKELLLPSGENSSFQMEANALHIWPRGEFMLIALPNKEGSFTVTLFLPNTGETSFESLSDEKKVIPFFQKRFPDFVDYVPDVIEQFFSHPTGHLGTIKTTRWQYQDKALILGDAAHAIVPFHGQGMNAAFESVKTLGDCINEYPNDWHKIFNELETRRKPNTDAIADMALENYIEMRNTVTDPHYQLKKALAFELETRYPDQFIPRYSMIMFHLLPYNEAKRLGVLQENILNELCQGIHSIDQVDFNKAKALINEVLS